MRAVARRTSCNQRISSARRSTRCCSTGWSMTSTACGFSTPSSKPACARTGPIFSSTSTSRSSRCATTSSCARRKISACSLPSRCASRRAPATCQLVRSSTWRYAARGAIGEADLLLPHVLRPRLHRAPARPQPGGRAQGLARARGVVCGRLTGRALFQHQRTQRNAEVKPGAILLCEPLRPLRSKQCKDN